MIAVLLLAASLAWGAEPSPAVARLEAALSPSVTARRLLVADGDVPRREAHDSGLPLAVDERGGGAPEIVLDLERLEDLPRGEAEAEYALALARAAIASPVPLVDAEQASRQWAAQALVEDAAVDAAFSKRLRAAELAPDSAAVVLDRAAVFLDQFERDSDGAYWAVESGGPREAVRLADLEDLFALRAADIRALKAPPEGPYGVLARRRYPGPLSMRAAYRLRAPGALERLREALGAYDTVGVAPLGDAIKRWRRILLAR